MLTVAELYKATFYCLLGKMLCTNDLKTGVSCLVLAGLWFKMWGERGAFIFYLITSVKEGGSPSQHFLGPQNPESTWKSPWSSWHQPKSGRGRKRKAMTNIRLISVRNRSVFQQSDSLLSLPLSPCWLRKGRPEINRLCKKVRLAGTTGIELTVY